MALIGNVSGSLTKLTDGTSYLIAGSNVTITTGSNGAVTIDSTGGGAGPQYFTSPQSGQIATTGSLVLWGPAATIPSSVGSDVFTFISGNNGIPLGGPTPAPSKVSLFYGDLAVSGAIRGVSNFGTGYGSAYVSDIHIFSNLNVDNINYQGQGDVGILFGGIAGSKNALTKGTSVFVGDVVVSGSLYDSNGNAYSPGAGSSPQYFTSPSAGNLYTTGSVAFVGGLAATKPSDFGSDVVFFVSGNTFLGNNSSATTGALFKGDLLLSGAVIGKSNVGIGKNALVAQSQLVAVLDPNDSATQALASDVFAYVSGAIGSKGTGTRGTTILGGDVVTSGSQHVGTTLNVTGATYMSDSATMTKSQNASTTFSISNTNAGTSAQANFNVATNAGNFYFGGGATAGSFSGGGFLYTDANIPLTIWTNNVKRATISGSGDTYFNVPTFRVGSTALTTVGADVNFSVSGSSGAKDGSTRGVAVFGGDVVVSGTLYGGVAFGSSTTLTLRSSKVQVTGNALSIGQSGGNDVNFFASGSVGSKNGATPGTALFGGDVVISGTIYNSAGVAYSTTSTTTGTFNDASAGLVTTASISFAGAQGAAYFASRSIGSSTGADVFFYVSGTARQGHGSTPGLAAKRTLFNGDVVTSGTLQLLGAGYTSIIGSDTLLFVSGNQGSKGTAFTRGTSVFAGDIQISGTTHLGTVAENYVNSSSVGSTLNFDLTNQSLFYINNATANITANFTNVPTFSDRMVSANLVVSQSAATARIVSAVQVAGVSQTINWANGVTPTGNTSKHDIFGFSLIRSGSVWVVLGQMSTYG